MKGPQSKEYRLYLRKMMMFYLQYSGTSPTESDIWETTEHILHSIIHLAKDDASEEVKSKTLRCVQAELSTMEYRGHHDWSKEIMVRTNSRKFKYIWLN